jgi:hypothetical protein
MKKQKLRQIILEEIRKVLNDVSNPYSVNWLKPDESYFRQELDELLGNEMRFDKAEFFHPQNYDLIYSILPKAFKKIAEHSINSKINDPKEIKKILLNKSVHDLMNDWGNFRHVLMKDKEAQQEALKLFKMGELIDWPNEMVNKTFYMGKPSKVFKGNSELGINKTSSQMIKKYKDIEYTGGYVGNLEKFRKAAKEKRAENLPAPFVMKLPSGGRDGNVYNLIGGHKRSAMASQLNIPIKVWLINPGTA